MLVSLSFPLMWVAALVVAPSAAPSLPAAIEVAAEEPVVLLVEADASSPPAALPIEGVAPLGRAQTDRPGEPPSSLPVDGFYVLEDLSLVEPRGETSLPHDGAEPLDELPATSIAPPVAPLGLGPKPEPPAPIDPKATRLVRFDVMVGAMWRSWSAPKSESKVDPSLSTSVEYGRMHGLSGAFHTEMLVVTDRDSVRALDFPLGVGAIVRGRLRNRPLYGSVGLTAGILVHRASRDEGVIHRVDPDFRIPIRLAWTVRRVGASLALVAGYSVRERIYEQRGALALERAAFRIGLTLGLHWDLAAGPAVRRPRKRS